NGFVGNARFLASGFIVNPALWQVQTETYGSIIFTTAQSRIDPNLAIVGFSKLSAPLPGNANGLFAFFGQDPYQPLITLMRKTFLII
ncbi:MAG: hypothetical protein PVH37_26245, partial [Desulfobacterales bacterium]